MAPVLCDVWQMGYHADDIEDGKATWVYEVLSAIGKVTDVVPSGANIWHPCNSLKQ